MTTQTEDWAPLAPTKLMIADHAEASPERRYHEAVAALLTASRAVDTAAHTLAASDISSDPEVRSNLLKALHHINLANFAARKYGGGPYCYPQHCTEDF